MLNSVQAATAGIATGRPNFLIIGAAKSGTTALWHYLRQHPQIYMSPRKHTRHFAYEVADPGFRGPGPENPSVPYALVDNDAYHALFNDVEEETAVGEASHSYLYRPEAPGRIRAYAPGMKLIAMLRDPVERAFSHHRQMIRDGREPIGDFALALEEEGARVRDRWWPDFHYVRMGLYNGQLKRYFDLFERDQIRVYLYDDFRTNPSGVLQDIFRFLDVDDAFVPEATVTYNASGIPKSRIMHSSLQNLRKFRPVVERVFPRRNYRFLLRVGSDLHNRNLTKLRLRPEVREKVIDAYFQEDTIELQRLVQRDLAAWLA